jgi:ferredoxin
MSELLNVYADLPFATRTPAGMARDAALQAGAAVEVEATSLVGYRSAGYLLIIGEADAALSAAQRVGTSLHRTVVICGPIDSAPELSAEALQAKEDPSVTVLRGEVESLSGHLGHFVAMLRTIQGESLSISELNGTQHPFFDLVLDLQPRALLGYELPPFGYYWAGTNSRRLERALAEIPEMTGEFEKPKFFNYSPEICAHGNSGLTGCTRCIDVCPTSAISSAGTIVEVDPYLCQGGGSCTAVCPTGAMIYAYPGPKDQIARVRAMLATFREAGGENPLLLFHDDEAGVERLRECAAEIPERVIPVRVAEIGSVGMDLWLSSLAYGAGEVVLLDTPAVPASVRGALQAQMRYAHSLLAAMGYETERLQLASDQGSVAQELAAIPAHTPVAPASFDTFNEKRGTLRLAIDHLYERAFERPVVAQMPAGAPFGQIMVAADKCTLCMSCVQVCPTRALGDAGDKPQLNFTEDLCVQCGLCQTACPEEAISLEARFLFAWEERRQPRVLNEEPPFCCVSCGKPFATASVIERMTARLSDHAMFKGEAERRRLRMCGDCRVTDLFAADIKDAPRPKVYGQ